MFFRGAGRAAGSAYNAFMRASPTTKGAVLGAAWGAVSDDTSVLGGAVMGAGMGRYGASGMRRAALGYRGIGVPGARGAMSAARGFGRGVWNRMRMDYRGARMATNDGLGKIRGLYRQ